VSNGKQTRARRSLVTVWLEQSAHPLVALAVVLVLEAAALGGLVWWAGWHGIVHALSIENAPWFGLCAGGQIVAYFGYTLALRAVAAVDDGVRLDLAVAFGIVSVGFAPIFSANTGGGFSIDAVTLREAGMTRRRAFRRVLALSALEYAVLAPAVAGCGLLLFLHIGGQVSDDIALPWLAVIPGVAVAAWLTSRRHANWSRVPPEAGWVRRSFAHGVAALTVLRSLVVGSERAWTAFAGAALYWLGDMVTLWAALRVFDVRLSLPVLVLAYGTGWALTRRSLPFGGPGMVEILLAWVLTWFHVPAAPAAAGVVAYRLFNFWLALVPAAIVIPFAKRLQRKLVREAATS
jgi:uncharacterized membrane protein YbhN (UPF0104 family)